VLDYALDGDFTQLKHGHYLLPCSRLDANCATILVSITDWVRRCGGQSDKGTLEGPGA
jgi:hypothetical protein